MLLFFYEGFIVLVSHPNTNPAEQGLTLVKFSITKLSDAQRAHLRCKEVVRELENYQHVSPRSQCFSLLFYLLFLRDWNSVFQYHTIQCLLIFCSTCHRPPSVCFTEASRLFYFILFIFFFRVGKSLACHSPGKWCLCA